MISEGKAYTSGNSFRARAEAKQRQYRADVLKIESGEHAHWLKQEDADRGKNFYGSALDVVKARYSAGKGVDIKRTLVNMLSSQAMCFNIFGNLKAEDGQAIASKALRTFLPSIRDVKRICVEYTPSNDVFGDQSVMGGVDCDVLIEYDTASGGGGLLAIETKFVEEEFSTCAYRKRAGTNKPGVVSCNEGTCPGEGFRGCKYTTRREPYRYWHQSQTLQTLKPDVIAGNTPCPFGDGLWQLWVNHTLVHAEARKRQSQEAAFAVCAPNGNDVLLKGGKTIKDFHERLTNPDSMLFIPVEGLIDALASAIGSDPSRQEWIAYLRNRYII